MTMEKPLRCVICDVDIPNKESVGLHLLGKRHLRTLNFCKQKKDAEEKGIFVKGFPKQTDEVLLQAFFRQFGSVRQFIYGHNGNFAIVQFCKRESAQMCLSERLYFSGHHLHVKPRKMGTPLKCGPPPPQDAAGGGLDHTHVTSALASCEDNFQSQLSTLLNEIHLSDNSKYEMVCQYLEASFSVSYPGCKARAFGSAVTGLALKGSDLDVFMNLNVTPDLFIEVAGVSKPVPESPSRVINHAKRILQRDPKLYSNIFAIAKAKTPIVKFIHKPTKITCDLSFKNALGVNNSAMVKFYLSMDPRLRPFLIIIKYWAKKNDLSGQGKFSNYALVMLALFYLQQLEHPIIPTVAALQEGVNEKLIVDDWECSINTNISLPNSNTKSVPELLCGFFKFCSNFDYGMKVICPLTGTSLLKSEFQTPEALPDAMRRYKEYVSGSGSDIVAFKFDCDMCIQDPFELRHNVTAGMTSKALENFKKYCEAAAKVCDDELSSTDSNAPGLLKKLLDERTKPSGFSRHITILPGKYLIEKLLPECVDLGQQESSADTQDKLRRKWYKSVLEVLVQIFEDVMKFKVHIEDSEHNSKIQKLDGQSDVAGALSCADMKFIHCCGYCRIWEGRKSASKKMKFAENMEGITRERIISDFLCERKQQASTCDPVITFCCTFQPKQEPTQVILELTDKKSQKSDFMVLTDFLQRHLPIWIEKCLKWQQIEQQVKKEA